MAREDHNENNEVQGERMPFVRIGKFKAKENLIPELCQTYSNEAIPAIRAAKGNISAVLLQQHESKEDFLAITIWKTKEDAEAYDKSGQAQQMIGKVKHTFSGHTRVKDSDWALTIALFS
jgi:heme-degrading monooxygenase HmoA